MPYLLLLIIFLISQDISAQDMTYIDSVKASLGNIDDSLLVDELNELAFSYVVRSNEKGILIAREAYKLAERSNLKLGKLDAIRCIGIDFDIKGNADSASHYYDIFLEQSIQLNDSLRIGRAFNNKGLLFWHQGKFNEAIDLFYNYLKISEDLNDSIGIANSCNNIGLIYMELKQHQKSLEYSLRSYEIRKVKRDSIRIASSCNNIGISYKNIDNFDSALFYYNEGIAYAKPLNNERKLAELYTNLAKLYILEGDYQEGYEILLLTLQLNQSYSAKAALYNNLSEVCYLLKMKNEALDYAMKAYELNEELSSYGHMQNAFRNLANAYYLNGDFSKAQEYFMKWGITKDSIFSEKYATSVADLESKYQVEKKEKEIARQELEIAKQNLKIITRNRLIAGVSSSLLIVFFLGLYLFQRSKRKAQMEKDEAIIREKDKGLKAIILAQEEERKRIAKDLHDGVVQKIAGITLAWRKLIEGEESKKEESALLKNLDFASQEIRNISHEMMPRALGELGIVAAIEDMLEKSLKVAGIDYNFETLGKVERLDELIEINLFRVSQELIHNIIKHSKASFVDFQLIYQKGAVQMVVEDNGIGINSKNKKGIGLSNIASRVQAVNGELTIEKASEIGTFVRIKIALNHD